MFQNRRFEIDLFTDRFEFFFHLDATSDLGGGDFETQALLIFVFVFDAFDDLLHSLEAEAALV